MSTDLTRTYDDPRHTVLSIRQRPDMVWLKKETGEIDGPRPFPLTTLEEALLLRVTKLEAENTRLRTQIGDTA